MKKKTILIGALVLLLALVVGLVLWGNGSRRTEPEAPADEAGTAASEPAAQETPEPEVYPNDGNNMDGDFTPLEIEEDASVEIEDGLGEAGG